MTGDEVIELGAIHDARGMGVGERDDAGFLQLGAGTGDGFGGESEVTGRIGAAHGNVDVRGVHGAALFENVEEHRQPAQRVTARYGEQLALFMLGGTLAGMFGAFVVAHAKEQLADARARLTPGFRTPHLVVAAAVLERVAGAGIPCSSQAT